jgi:hypothetical protein
LAQYVLEPDGIVFTPETVTLSVVADVSTLTQLERDNLDLYREESGTFVALGAMCNVVGGTATCIRELEHFSTYALIAPLDSDSDGVPDNYLGEIDICPGTAIPESIPTNASGLGANRWALVDDDFEFDQADPQAGSVFSFSTTDTRGCSCEQIIEEAGLGNGQTSRGCSTSAILNWTQ